MKIKSVAVLGAGAVGSYVIWGLSQKPEVRLGVIAEGERADRLREMDVRIMAGFTIRRCGHQKKHIMWICWWLL